MQEGLLPLFPLPVVVFPRTPLPLHIFEERYKEMIGEAIENRSEFGVVLAREQGVVNTGCTAVVEKVLRRYPDGRMDILAMGRRRFEILLLNQDKAYLRGAIQFFDDEEDAAVLSEMREQAIEIYRILRAVEQARPLWDPVLADPQVSFQLAQAISDVDFRQALLPLRSEAERLKQLLEFLPGYVEKQRYAAGLKRAAPGNGHGHAPGKS